MIKLSIVIITLNEEKNLARCLDAVKDVADEIIIIDSGSTDNTLAIAGNYNAKIIQHSFSGYASQKNFGTQQAANDWVLSLDADEALTPQLAQSIFEVKKNPKHLVYQMSRLTNYCGKWIKHCGWYPDRQTRLYNRAAGYWEDKKVHEYWRLKNEGTPMGKLKGDLLHYSFTSISEHLKKIEKYTELAAREAVEKGKDAGFIKTRISPRWHFITEYFFKLGFLDGFYGYIICRLSAYSTFIKYTKIKLYNKQKEINPSRNT
jgi:glycosyltransferase involved in cell wall biosynthesis